MTFHTEHRFKCCVSWKNEYEFRGCDHFCLKGLLKEVGCKSEKAIHLVRSVISSMAHLSQSV